MSDDIERVARAVAKIIDGLTNRRAFRHVFDNLDDDITEEIKQDMGEAIRAAMPDVASLTKEAERLRAVLDGFQRIGFKPCKDPACYRSTLDMMQRAHAALCDAAAEPQAIADARREMQG